METCSPGIACNANPHLYFVQVNSTSSVIYRYGSDNFINPSQAVYKAGQWYVAGSNNNSMSEIGGASWAVYNGGGSRIAQGPQDNYSYGVSSFQLTFKADTVTQATNDIITGNQNAVVRTCTVTISP